MNTSLNIVPLLPEIILAIGAMALLMLGVYRTPRSETLIDALSIILLVIAGVAVVLLPEGKLVTFGGSFVVDNFARFLKVLAIAGSAAAILMSIDYDRREGQQRFEYSVLIVLSTLGTILSAAYALWLYRKVIFGKLEKPSLFDIKDVGWREMVILAPLVILTIVFGVYPKPVLDISAASVAQLMDNYQHALEPIKAAMAR